MYLTGIPVLHVVDWVTAYQAARFLESMSSTHTWEALRACWIDTYLGPPDIISHDPGTNLASTEFKESAKLMGITCVQAPVESHNSIGKVERYHAPLRRAFEIITNELGITVSRDVRLQMAVKACNDTVGPDGLVPTLLVYGAFPRMTHDSPPSQKMVQRAAAVNKAMTELRNLMAKRKVNDALNTRNGPNTTATLPAALAIGEEVLVYREPGKWTGPYKVLATADNEITVDTVDGALKFRVTMVKPYYRHPDAITLEDVSSNIPETTNDDSSLPFEYPVVEQPRRRGRARKIRTTYLSDKERSDLELAMKLRIEGIITTPGTPFEASDDKELKGLFETVVLKPIQFDERLHGSTRIFKSRMMREIKGKNTDAPYEKSRLVVQGYNDIDKFQILTQSPTIQRSSQRLLLALTPALRLRNNCILASRDITQAYPQSKTTLERQVFVHLPVELKDKFAEGTILHVIKPLYGISESGVHWFATYQTHHIENLKMGMSSYDPCLLVTKQGEHFGMTGLQTDDTLHLGTREFIAKEVEQLQKAGFKSKPLKIINNNDRIDFNGCRVSVDAESVKVVQKGQAEKLATVEKCKNQADQFTKQRVRGAYLASICQPEATFDYSVAAQTQNPTNDDIEKLNKRIQWRMDNNQRGLRYISLDLEKARLMVFADGSFANNKGLSS
ncbi:hypothetical protein K3495_g9027 [Podosphaera aphanis]|nr:hypothetical protein K3495_g9027 [Podosphaera aphanis]